MLDLLVHSGAVLLTAWLFGGMLLFAAGFAAFLFKVLPVPQARSLIRQAFPPFYIFVMVTSGLAACLFILWDLTSAALLATIALTTLPTRQVLMPAINQATDQGLRARFVRLHGLSVVISLAHIALSGWVLVRVMP
jgi:hypothetical protein